MSLQTSDSNLGAKPTPDGTSTTEKADSSLRQRYEAAVAKYQIPEQPKDAPPLPQWVLAGPPKMPAEIDDPKNPNAPCDFAEFYLTVYGFTFNTNNLDLLRSLENPQCESCKVFEDGFVKDRVEGGWDRLATKPKATNCEIDSSVKEKPIVTVETKMPEKTSKENQKIVSKKSHDRLFVFELDNNKQNGFTINDAASKQLSQ
ncbi:hypothetical protein BK816_04125 [Boudabousia tangfeifanii]|uniref:Uncharacterized protein n=1 Tax=Boudabousia tangfeifanii TaxID=1912795 RepID=A0A1D9MJQ8_9ACTO|nr:hypothetical protein BK816_04125 [Boudabousia tangfeifanii]